MDWFAWRRGAVGNVIPTSHTDFVSFIPLFLLALMPSQCYWQGKWAQGPQCLCGPAVRCWSYPCIKGSELFSEATTPLITKIVQERSFGSETEWHDIAGVQTSIFAKSKLHTRRAPWCKLSFSWFKPLCKNILSSAGKNWSLDDTMKPCTWSLVSA